VAGDRCSWRDARRRAPIAPEFLVRRTRCSRPRGRRPASSAPCHRASQCHSGGTSALPLAPARGRPFPVCDCRCEADNRPLMAEIESSMVNSPGPNPRYKATMTIATRKSRNTPPSNKGGSAIVSNRAMSTAPVARPYRRNVLSCGSTVTPFFRQRGGEPTHKGRSLSAVKEQEVTPSC